MPILLYVSVCLHQKPATASLHSPCVQTQFKHGQIHRNKAHQSRFLFCLHRPASHCERCITRLLNLLSCSGGLLFCLFHKARPRGRQSRIMDLSAWLWRGQRVSCRFVQRHAFVLLCLAKSVTVMLICLPWATIVSFQSETCDRMEMRNGLPF